MAIKAFRIWDIVKRETGFDLRSIREFYLWIPGINLAVCKGYGHPADEEIPAKDCTCGFYGLQDLDVLELSQYRDFTPCEKATEDCHKSKPLACGRNPVLRGAFPHCQGPFVGERAGSIFGSVLLSGRRVEGEKGHRAKEAEICVLYSNYVPACLLEELSKRYRVPIIENPDLPSFEDLLSVKKIKKFRYLIT